MARGWETTGDSFEVPRATEVRKDLDGDPTTDLYKYSLPFLSLVLVLGLSHRRWGSASQEVSSYQPDPDRRVRVEEPGLYGQSLLPSSSV